MGLQRPRDWHYTPCTAATKTTVSSSALSQPRPREAPAGVGTARLGAAPAGAGTLGEQLSFGGNLSFTSDYIYHGVSESNDRGALQGDLHLATTERQLRRGVGLDPRQPARPRRQLRLRAVSRTPLRPERFLEHDAQRAQPLLRRRAVRAQRRLPGARRESHVSGPLGDLGHLGPERRALLVLSAPASQPGVDRRHHRAVADRAGPVRDRRRRLLLFDRHRARASKPP